VSSSPRTPSFVRFILTGAVLGFVVGGAIASTGWLEGRSGYPTGYAYSEGQAVGYLGLFGALLFALAAAVLAVLLDRRD
jgi:hypothetical protein